MQIQLQNGIFQRGAGGIENYLYYSSKTLIKMGHDPTILCAQNPPDLPLGEIYEGIRIVRHPPFTLPALLYSFYLTPYEKMVEKFIYSVSADTDAIVSRHPLYAYASCKVTSATPVVYVQASVWPTMLKMSTNISSRRDKLVLMWRLPQERRLEHHVLTLCNSIIVLSKIRKREICDFYRLPQERLKVIAPGIDLERFNSGMEDPRIRKELNIPPQTRIILTVCRLSAEKNVQALIRAAAKISSIPWILVVVGEGPRKADLERLAVELDLMNRIRFVGLRTDVERFYSIADLFVLPSPYEGFGHVFLEAMASGVPCIRFASEYPNIIVASDEIIENGRTGFCVDPYSVEDLADKIESVITDDEMRHRMGAESRKKCEKKYSWEKHVEAVIKTIQTL